MRFRIVLLSLALLFLAQGTSAQKGPDKTPATTEDEAVVIFANGSTVRMAVLQENFEVVTEFGKLTIPAGKVRRIDFGIHLPEGTEEKIAAALQKLDSPQFKERDTAVNDLVKFGAHAYPALVVAAKKTTDPEVTQRLKMALERIRAKVPENLLKLRQDDIIVTTKFTIAGRIVSPTIRAKAEHFGDLKLAITGLRAISWNVSGGETEVTVDAAKYAAQGQEQWLDTGFTADGISKLTITASGFVDQWPQQPGGYMSGPNGVGGGGPGNLRPGFNRVQFAPGALLGRIGEAGEPFVVGERYQGTPSREGKLYLRILPSPWQCDSTGSYRVKVSATE